MDSEANNSSESSLPTQPVHIYPSSPPILQQSEVSFEELGKMNDVPHLKIESPNMQQNEDSKSPVVTVNSGDEASPVAAQQVHSGSDDDTDDEDAQGATDVEADPSKKIVDFDWDALHQRYHEAMKSCHEEEGALIQEWESLMNYFRIWAESGHEHETDRTFQRLKTRTAYVQHAEDRLERTRNHYINVVQAFESALNLLKVHGFDR